MHAASLSRTFPLFGIHSGRVIAVLPKASPVLWIGAAAIPFIVLAILVIRWVLRAAHSQPLRSYYQRLGELRPADGCYCKSGRLYSDCCRSRDVERLTRDVESRLMQDWSHRTYGGRRRIQTLAERIEARPLPRVRLPEWVIEPEKYTFPISREKLMQWTPSRSASGAETVADVLDQGDGSIL